MGNDVIVVTGASSGFGRLSAEALALAGHTVYASMRDTAGRNASQVEAAADFAKHNGVDLRTVEMDVQSQSSVGSAIGNVFNANGRIDVVVHNAGHMVFGPAEAFTPKQLAELYDINVVSTQRVNRAVLPHMRRQQQGLLVDIEQQFSGRHATVSGALLRRQGPRWIHSRCPMRASWSVGASRLPSFVPGAFTSGTNHFDNAGSPADQTVADEYEAGPYAGFGTRVQEAFDAIVPPDADVSVVADALVNVVDTPFGKRPFRIHIDPAQDGADVGFAVLDRLRAEMLHRVGLSDRLNPARLV